MKLFIVGLLLLLATAVRANVVLPDVISTAMVLQRDRAVPIWGKADPGETVTVHFAGKTRSATAGQDGEWIVRLDAMHANATPASMIIEGKNKIELKDILMGEVWLVAGQSNM